MKQQRVAHTVKASEFNDKRVRPAIRNPGANCVEMTCVRAHEDHKYGQKGCTYVQLEDKSVITRTEAEETTTRKDRMRATGRVFGQRKS